MIFQYFDDVFGLTIVLLGIILLACSVIRFIQFKQALRQDEYRQENGQDFIGYVPIYATYYPGGLYPGWLLTSGAILLLIGILLC